MLMILAQHVAIAQEGWPGFTIYRSAAVVE